MDRTFLLFLLIGNCVAIFSFFMLHRNTIVFKERTRLLNLISTLANEDIGEKKEWKWRYDKLEEYSYNKMMWQLFKFHWNLQEILNANTSTDK